MTQGREEAGSAGMRRTRWLATALLLPGLAALASGSALVVSARLPWQAGLGHSVVGMFGGAIAGLVGLAIGIGSGRARISRWPYLIAGAPLFALLVTAGFGDWVARRSWGMDLNAKIFLGFLPHAAELLELLGWRGALLLASWFGVIAALTARWSSAMAAAERAWMPRSRPRGASLAGVAALLGCIAAAVTAGSNSRFFEADPLLGVLRRGEEPMLAPTARRLSAWAEDEQQRALFDAGTPHRKHLVLILSDGVRPENLDFYGYSRATTPFLSRLARTPGWVQVPRAYSAATESLGGIGSILSGRSTRSMSARSYGIVEFLARAGFRTHLLLNGEHDWYDLREMYGPRVTTFRDIRRKSADIPLHDDEQIVAWAGELPAADDTPAFVMIFMMGTHQLSPLTPADAYFTRGRGVVPPFWVAPQDDAGRSLAVDRYDDQLRAMDRRLEETWKVLETKGYLKDCVVIFSSDHGQMLGEHGAFGHGADVWERSIRIPLALWSDGPRPDIDTDRTAWTPDLAPTLADAAGLRPLPTWEGISLYSRADRRAWWVESVTAVHRVRAVFLDAGTKRWKLHQSFGADGEVIAEQLYELNQDPGETEDLLGRPPGEELAHLRAIAAGGSPDGLGSPTAESPDHGRPSARR